MSDAPSVPPTVDNIHPLSAKPSQAELSFITDRFNADSRKEFSRLEEGGTLALMHFLETGVFSEIAENDAESRTFLEREAKKIWTSAKDASSTAAPQSQSETDQSPTANGDRTDDTRTGASGTAHQQ